MHTILGRGGGLVDRAADLGPYDWNLIPLGEKEAGDGPYLKKCIPIVFL